jgi:hypothetical protein
LTLFDIQLFTLNLVHGREQSALPGVVALTAPRRSARGRENDSLVALVSISEPSTFTGESLQDWVKQKADSYFSTPGTVTFAMRALVDTMNADLLDRNLKSGSGNPTSTATLSLAVVRRDAVTLLNIGSARAFYVNQKESLILDEGEPQGRGLGISQAVNFRFVQEGLAENTTLVLSPTPPAAWNAETFAGSATLSSEAVNRRLFIQAGNDLKAVVLRFTPGKGLITQTDVKRNQITKQNEIVSPNLPPEAPTKSPEAPTPNETQRLVAEPALSRAELRRQAYLNDEKNRVTIEKIVEPVSKLETSPTRESSVDSRQPNKIKPEGPTDLQVKAGRITKNLADGVSQTSGFFARFSQKILPGLADEPLRMSRTALIAIAVAVPLLIALLAGMVYASSGKTQQFNQNLVMAQQYSIQAEAMVADPAMRLANLKQAIIWLDKAESYGRSDASSSLRNKVQGALDVMEGVVRLEMIPVVTGGLSAGSSVTQIIALATDLYLLDEDSGTVQRFFLGGAGYEKDEAFECGPNPDNPLSTIGNLVDMIPVNINNSFKATLLAVDAAGNIQFCIPGEVGVTSVLPQPDQGWKKISAIAYDGGYFYALDKPGNAVYRLEANGIQFDAKPTLYFDDQIPSLTQAIDIEVNGDELYILRSNGQMVECTYSHMKDYKLTECLDPAPFGDMRAGQTPETISFPDAKFVQMRMTAAPDSSIYLLDASSKALFHFSLQRNLQKIMNPRFSDGTNIDRLTPTAVAVSSGRVAFMAFGNQVYYAPLP